MTRGKAGCYSQRRSLDVFEPMAVVLTTGTSYTVPDGATTMKAWAVGGGANRTSGSAVGGAGGVAVKTWAVSAYDSISYSVSAATANNGTPSATTVTFGGTTITGNSANGQTGGTGSGGDVNASGGSGGTNVNATDGFYSFGGAVGGNAATPTACNRVPATTVSGLLAAVELAGVSISEACNTTAAFGSGASQKTSTSTLYAAGIGGGGVGVNNAGGGAVVLYFT